MIINKFYPSYKLNDIDTLETFYNNSILFTAKLLDLISYLNISKIIYSSSSSVYNSIGNDNHLGNRDLYSSSKLACENMIKNFCKKKSGFYYSKNIQYGGNDQFSIISKIQNAIKYKKHLLK